LTAAAAPSKEDEEDSSGGGWTADGSSSSSVAAAVAAGSRGEERLAASRALFSSHALALHLQPETHIRRQATRHDCRSHCKKRFAIFPSPAGMSLTNQTIPGR